MDRLQRLRSMGNLLQLRDIAQNSRLQKLYEQQYDAAKSREMRKAALAGS